MATIRERAAALNLTGKIYNPMHRPPAVPKTQQGNVLWSSIISHLQTQVKVKRRRQYLRSHSSCFLGSDAVDVIQAYVVQSKVFGDANIPRTNVVCVCQILMDCKVFEAIGTGLFGKEKTLSFFQDSDRCLYRFLDVESPLLNHESLENALLRTGDQTYCSTCSWQDEQVCFHSTPVKFCQELTFLDKSSSSMQTNSGLPQSLINEVWQEQTIQRLLQLIDLPLLDGLLDTGEGLSPLPKIMDDPDLLHTSNYMDREILKAFRNTQTDDWLSAALDCLDFLPDQLVVNVSRELPVFGMGDTDCDQSSSVGADQCKLFLFDTLSKHYGQANTQPLLTNHMFDIYTKMTELMESGKMAQALEVLQLCLKLLPAEYREELHRLLCFMALAADPAEVKLHKETENRMVVMRTFSRAIVHSKSLPKGRVDLLIFFMLDNHQEIFKIPGSLHKLVSEHLDKIVQGDDNHMKNASTFCQQVPREDFTECARETTKRELLALLKNIDENSKYSGKERKRLLAQFYQGHPEIFLQYFGPRASSVNLL